MQWFSDPVELARAPGIDVFVELMGGAGDPAKSAVEAALAAGKPVVTANKALLAKYGVRLAGLAEKHHAALNFEAAVGGAIPIVKTIREGLAGNAFGRIYGILNGTCNYILTRMEQERLSFAECLAAAKALGYAEADPAFDVGGHDTAHKLALLTAIAFGTEVDAEAIYVEGISSIDPADIDYINAHGTSTPMGDEIELAAVERLFGNAAGKVSMSSTKSAIGHLLGAAGAVEAIFSALAIRDNLAPPTLNLDNPSVATAIDLVPHQARHRTIDTVLSNSFGFGGTNASLILRRYDA